MAKIIGIDTSNYSRKERGEVKIFDDEWEKIAKTLEVALEDIKNKEVKSDFQKNKSAQHDPTGGNVNYYNIPDFFIHTNKKYIEKLEKEIQFLKEENKFLKSQVNR